MRNSTRDFALNGIRRAAILALGLLIFLALGCREQAKPAQKPPAPPSPASSARTPAAPAELAQTEPPAAPPSRPDAEKASPAPVAADLASTPSLAAGTEDDDIPSTAPRLVLSGRVTLESGEAAEGAKVELLKIDYSNPESLRADPVKEATAGDDGQYRMVVQDSPIFKVLVTREGSGRVARMIQDPAAFRAGGTQTGVREVKKDFVLPQAAVVAGTVLDEKDKPVAGVTVSAAMESSIEGAPTTFFISGVETVTDAEGRFRFADMPKGKVSVSIDDEDYVPASEIVTAPKEDVVLRVTSEGASLGGHVYLQSTGAAVRGAEVSIFENVKEARIVDQRRPRKMVTDETGAYRFDRLRAGEYHLQVKKDKLMRVPDKNPRGSMTDLAAKEKKLDVDLLLYPGHTIRGKVTVKETGEPIEGAMVKSSWGGPQSADGAPTGPNGEFILTGVSGTQVPLMAEKQGYKMVSPSPHMSYTLVQLEPEKLEVVQNLEMTKALTVSGVVKTESGMPVSNAQVSVFSRDHMSRQKKTPADANGAYEVEVDPFGNLRIKAEAPGYPAGVSELVEMKGDPVTGVDVVLKSAATVSGVVVDPDGKPASGVQVQASFWVELGMMTMTENVGNETTDGAGQFQFTNVPPARVRLSAQKTAAYAGSKTETLSLSAGEYKTGVTLQLRTSHYIAGRVTDAEGNPVSNAHVWGHSRTSDDNSSANAQTDADGRYRLEGLAEATYWINVSHSEKGNESKQDVQADRDDVDFVLGEKSKITLVGKVVDAVTKQPVEDFTVGWSYGGMANVKKDPAIPGKFTLDSLQGGVSYSLIITAPGYAEFNSGYIQAPKGVETFEREFAIGKGGTLTGRVVERGSARPLAGVKVLLRGTGQDWEIRQRQPVSVAATGEDGKFLFSNVSSGNNTIDFAPPAPMVGAAKKADVKNGETTDMGDVELGGGGAIRGRVVTIPGDIGVPKVQVTIMGQSDPMGTRRNAETDASGAFAFQNVTEGQYSVALHDRNLYKSAEVKGDGTAEVIFRIGTGTLKGRTLKGGKPCGAQISLSHPASGQSWHKQSSGDGTFEFTGLDAGSYTLNAYPGNNYEARLEDKFDLAAGQTLEKDLVFPGGRILGRVVDAVGDPVAGATVRARRGSANEPQGASNTLDGTSQGDGKFLLDGLRGGTYTVTASKDDVGMAIQEGVVVPEDGESAPVELRLGANEGGTVVSVALDMEGKPVQPAWCHLVSSTTGNLPHGMTRKPDGVVKIMNVPPGTYEMEVSSWGYSINKRAIEVKAGEEQTFEDVLYESGALRWTLTDAEGKTLVGVPCKLTPNDPTSIEEIREGETDSTGQFVVRGLYPGDYTGVATHSDGRTVTETFSIEAHQLVTRTTKFE